MHRRLRREVARTREDLVRLTQDLIRVPSPSLHEKEIARLVDGVMRRLGYDLVFTDDVGNIVGVVVGVEPGATVLVTSHMDTVRPEQVRHWTRPPFSGEVVDGRVYGVGAVDGKGSLASQIYAGHLLAASGVGLKGSVVVAATVADGRGRGVGVRHLLQTTLPDLDLVPTAVVFGSPTSLAVATGHDGWLGVDGVVRGEFEELARRAGEAVVQRLQRFREELGSVTACAVEGLDGPREMPADGGWRVTVRLRHALSPGESEAEIVDRLRSVILEATSRSRLTKVEVKVREEEQRLYTGHTRRVRLSVPPWSSDLARPVLEAARCAMREAGCEWLTDNGRGGRPGFGTAGAVSIGEFGVPAIGFGPGSELEAEHCDESVSLASLSESTYGTAVLVCGLGGTPLAGRPAVVEDGTRRAVAPAAGASRA